MATIEIPDDQVREFTRWLGNSTPYVEELRRIDREGGGKWTAIPGVPYILAGREVPPPSPRFWSWMTLLESPLCGEPEKLTDSDLFTALYVLCEGGKAMAPCVTFPAQERQIAAMDLDPEARARLLLDLSERTRGEVVRQAVVWIDETFPGLDTQTCADVVLFLVMHGPRIAITEKKTTATTPNGQRKSTPSVQPRWAWRMLRWIGSVWLRCKLGSRRAWITGAFTSARPTVGAGASWISCSATKSNG
jgi:hypothetical protein